MKWNIFIPLVSILTVIYYLWIIIDDRQKKKGKVKEEHVVQFATREVSGNELQEEEENREENSEVAAVADGFSVQSFIDKVSREASRKSFEIFN